MTIQISLPIIRRNPIQRITHISPDIIVPILIQRQRTTRVLHEEVQHADLVVADLGELGEDGVGDEVGAAAAGGEGEVLLEPGHCVWCSVVLRNRCGVLGWVGRVMQGVYFDGFEWDAIGWGERADVIWGPRAAYTSLYA